MRAVTKPNNNKCSKTAHTELLNTAEKDATRYTDEHGAFAGSEDAYRHQAVRHGARSP